ncbi:radical SAM protein [bacterium]|nr:radical SAM protein [bacterium]
MSCHFRHEQGLVLRVSVTERCNFRCRYCIPPGASTSTCGHPLALDRIVELCAAIHSLYTVRKLKITGGEPLVRSGLPGFIQRLSEAGLGEISLTTNASRLADMAEDLKAASLARVNISLDTLNAGRFRDLTSGLLDDTLSGIESAVAFGLTPVKLNAVLRRSSWREDVPELLGFAAERGLQVRFIELMRTGPTADWAAGEYISAAVVRDWLQTIVSTVPILRSPDSPARVDELTWTGHLLRVGWITPHSNPFCDGCNRLRLDSSGRLYRCLMDPDPLPLNDLMTSLPQPELHKAVREYMQGKRIPAVMSTAGTMASIGG